jgi:hypothetical protein
LHTYLLSEVILPGVGSLIGLRLSLHVNSKKLGRQQNDPPIYFLEHQLIIILFVIFPEDFPHFNFALPHHPFVSPALAFGDNGKKKAGTPSTGTLRLRAWTTRVT